MQIRGGMNELMRQAARMQRKIEQAKKDSQDKEVVATSAGDKVKVTVTYGRKVSRIEIDPEFLKSGRARDLARRRGGGAQPRVSSKPRRPWKPRSRR